MALIGLVAGLYLSAATVAGIAWFRCGLDGCPDVARLRSYQPGKASRVLDRKGRLFAELRPVEGETLPLRRIPAHVRAAFLAIEDQRFYGHHGVDWRRAMGAALTNLRRTSYGEGFSTITMQLARNVFPSRIDARERSLGRKLLEMRVAYEIEDRFSKDEILELYLSHIYFGNGARGIDAAARHYFAIGAGSLSVAQAALLAALPKGPTVYDPRRHPDRARERRNLVLTLMERQRRIEPAAAGKARAAPLGVVRRRRPAGAEKDVAPYFVEEIRRQLEDRFGERLYDETLRVTATLDADIQRAAEEELQRQLRAVEAGALGRFRGPRYSASATPSENGTPYLQGALVALEVGTGDVLAWVGGRDFHQSRFDRVKSSRRQVGSAFKPFVYAAALAEGHVLSERLVDEPIRVRLARNRWWEPKNYDQDYEGEVTVRDALVRSKNVPTVRLADAVGLGVVAEVARKAGIESAIDPTPAMPLGTVAVSPLELATAYGAFAGLGQAALPRMLLRVVAESGEELWGADPPRVRRPIDPGVAFLVTNVLQDAVNRGTGAAVRALGFDGPAAGKTGTTNDATDAWFVGYTPEMVAAVWIGFDERRPIMAGASGGRVAAPAWARMMLRVYAERPMPAPWRAPATVFEARVDPPTGAPLADGCEPADGSSYIELFLRGKAPAAVCPDRGDLIAEWRSSPPADGEEDEARARRREDDWIEALHERMKEEERRWREWDRRRRDGWRY
ncbi:MAG TPA: PBP1A family penicillin-binding protein [Vicinamibacteria bacterium]|nr:PBP1A family penicillin-binding protein [Vicinamibacteria bacterium]